MIKEWINYLIKNGITPNQYYLLLSLQESVQALYLNTQVELRILKNSGWLDEQNHLTKKAEALLDDVESTFSKKVTRKRRFQLGDEHLQRINEYRELFPKGKLPSGKYARDNIKELLTNFSWFFETYPEYGWDVILQATKEYVESFGEGFMYMQTSKYFIKKEDKNKVITSGLATACDAIMEGENEEESPSHIRVL